MSIMAKSAQGQPSLAGPDSDAASAREASRALAHCVPAGTRVSLRVADAKEDRTVELPASALAPLKLLLEKMADGHSIATLPLGAELFISQAAKLLNVPRMHVVKLIKEGELPCRKVGEYPKVLTADLLAYQQASRKRSEAALDELVALSEELGLYDLT